MFLAFLSLIVIGTVALILPSSSVDAGFTPILTAFFTATSAVTVTGLVVEESATYWSPSGHVVLWALILVGGMGWLTIAGFMLVVLGQKITLRQRLALREPVGATQIGGVIILVRNTMLSFLALQIIGAIILTFQLRSYFDWTWIQAVGHGFFHAVSGFTNAGFTILPGSESLGQFSKDLTVLSVMGVLILLGGLSFPVMSDIARTRRFAHFSLDTKIVLLGSFMLWTLGGLVIFVMEFNNPDTLGQMGLPDKLLNAVFHSVSARSGGFSAFEMGALVPSTAFFLIGLMFIGSASASVGGGIRINTLGVLVATIWAAVRGRRIVTMFQREIDQSQVQRAVAITACAGIFVVFLVFILSLTEKHLDFIDLLFEIVSAIGTVGLSRGITPELSGLGKLLIIGTMVLGRIGPLVFALSLARNYQIRPLFRNTREQVRMG